MNNIYLIGMPGCGKSTVGRILSKELGIENIDADKYLEEKFGELIPDIFEIKGEDEFRRMETLTIEELSKKDNLLVSTGGGVVKIVANKEFMKKSGVVVFIDSSPDSILANSNLGGRPLLKDKNRIFDLYTQRIDLYRDFADITVDNNGLLEDTVQSLKQALIDANII